MMDAYSAENSLSHVLRTLPYFCILLDADLDEAVASSSRSGCPLVAVGPKRSRPVVDGRVALASLYRES